MQIQMGIHVLLALLALTFTLINGITNRVPLWVAVLILCLAVLI